MTDNKDSFKNQDITLEPELPIEPKVMGRKVTPLDENKIKEFLSVGMKVERIADYFNVTPKTLYNRFGVLINHMNVQFDSELLAKQREVALGGDTRMLVHLGKTRLKQSETIQVEANTTSKVEWVVETPKPRSINPIDEVEDDEE